MSAISHYHPSPRILAAVFIALVVALFGEVGTVVWVHQQGETQHQICQAFELVSDRTQQQITLTGLKLTNDIKKGDGPAVALDRKSISDATTFLIRVRRVKC